MHWTFFLIGESRSLNINLDGVIKGERSLACCKLHSSYFLILIALLSGNRVAILHLAKRGGGVIVNTASVAGFVGTRYVYSRCRKSDIAWVLILSIASFLITQHRSTGLLAGPGQCNPWWTSPIFVWMLVSFCMLLRRVLHRPVFSISGTKLHSVCPYWVETDILASINMPGVGFIAVAPKVPMKTVMDAYMKAILDESQHCKCLLYVRDHFLIRHFWLDIRIKGQTIVALPDGVHVEPAFKIWGMYTSSFGEASTPFIIIYEFRLY